MKLMYVAKALRRRSHAPLGHEAWGRQRVLRGVELLRRAHEATARPPGLQRHAAGWRARRSDVKSRGRRGMDSGDDKGKALDVEPRWRSGSLKEGDAAKARELLIHAAESLVPRASDGNAKSFGSTKGLFVDIEERHELSRRLALPDEAIRPRRAFLAAFACLGIV